MAGSPGQARRGRAAGAGARESLEVLGDGWAPSQWSQPFLRSAHPWSVARLAGAGTLGGRAAGFRCAGYHKGSKNHREPKANLPRLRTQSLLGCLSGTSQTCRGCRGELEIGHFIFSTTYDVPRVQGERPHARVQGAAPLPLPSPFPVFPFPFVSFVPFVIFDFRAFCGLPLRPL